MEGGRDGFGAKGGKDVGGGSELGKEKMKEMEKGKNDLMGLNESSPMQANGGPFLIQTCMVVHVGATWCAKNMARVGRSHPYFERKNLSQNGKKKGYTGNI